eukprot:TRINITY_DN90657_c0_g1_i1.p1 TRINITY_DN90657_c0_g1~~TRINITY_DN90657_c0_g1_i1.p1  ORF type:complete len:275 (-),score=78.13 TRINITY_DN90657_c0_g1_i1:23-847(-)
MPPKGKGTPKASAKGKAKAQVKPKGKAKAKAKAKAGKPAKTDRVVGEDAESSEQKKPKAKAKAGAVATKRILEAAAGKPFDVAIAEAKRRLHSVDATIAEAAALEEAQSSQAAAARKELDHASREIRGLIEEENASLQRHADIQSAKVRAAADTETKRRALLEAKHVLSLLEVEAARKQKREAAENLQQMTKAALAGVRALRGAGRRSVSKSADDEGTSAKRASTASSRSPEDGAPQASCKDGDSPKVKSPKSAVPDEADTVPATLQDDADDIE